MLAFVFFANALAGSLDEIRNQACDIHQTRCEGDDPSSCRALGQCYEQGYRGTVDLGRALALYKRACDATGHPLECSHVRRLESAAAPFRPTAAPENLLELVSRIQDGQRRGDEVGALIRGFYCDEARLRGVLSTTIDGGAFAAIAASHRSALAMSDAELAQGMSIPTDATVRLAHAATTEELAAYKPGSVAYNQFPGGAQQLAREVLRPGVTFYEVEVLRPTESAGTRYHLFFYDAGGWGMLGPMWRVLK